MTPDSLKITLNSLSVPVVEEYLFAKRFTKQRFRSDFAILPFGILIEYEGLPTANSKSRHTSIKGYAKDVEKYRLASILGYRLLRYTRYDEDLDVKNHVQGVIGSIVGDYQERKLFVPKSERKYTLRCARCETPIFTPVNLSFLDITKYPHARVCMQCIWLEEKGIDLEDWDREEYMGFINKIVM